MDAYSVQDLIWVSALVVLWAMGFRAGQAA